MSGIINKSELELVSNINVAATPSQGIHPETGEIVETPRVNIFHQMPGGDFEFLSNRDHRFALIQNRDVFQAVDDIAYDRGIDLAVNHASYKNGKTVVNFTLPGREFTVPGDSSAVTPGILTTNGYGGGAAYKHQPSAVRWICSNGLISKIDLAAATKRKHFGDFSFKDIYEMTAKSFDNLDRAVEVMKLTANISATTAVTDDDLVRFMTRLEKSVAEKHRETLGKVVASNVSELGQNAWAVTQGISEMFHHHMKEDRTGAKMMWRDEQVDRFLRSVGVEQKVLATVNA